MKNLTEKNVGVSCGEWKVSDSARRTNPPWPCSSPDERQATDLWLEDREGIRPKVHISSHSSQPFSPSPACSSEVISSHKHPACEQTSRYFPALLCVSLTHTHTESTLTSSHWSWQHHLFQEAFLKSACPILLHNHYCIIKADFLVCHRHHISSLISSVPSGTYKMLSQCLGLDF